MLEHILQCDKTVFLGLNFDGGALLDRFFLVLTDTFSWMAVYLLIVVLLWRRYGWRYTLLAVAFIAATAGLMAVASEVFKEIFQRPRPLYDTDLEGLVHTAGAYHRSLFGTVSGHTAASCAIMTLSTTLVRRKWFTVLMIVWVVLVAYSRIYLGLHFPLDIVLGAVMGIVTGVLMVRLFRRMVARFSDR
ncbi:phosphatase PAP2 family protein [Alistipes sp. OttesenSCG-928-B03]|nr:phosphatase PAP2 family protein [Alistipes sp. OttesenSCG-928-B03]